MARFLSLLIGLLFVIAAAPAHAEVSATFYSHDFGDHFPHGFVKLKGTVDSTGEAVDTNFGFTAVSVSPAILVGSVKGMIEIKDTKYIASSNPHFTLRLSDREYVKFMAFVEEWRKLPGKSYSLSKRNCVHFVMEAAALLGLNVNRQSKIFKKPKSFILETLKLNPELRL